MQFGYKTVDSSLLYNTEKSAKDFNNMQPKKLPETLIGDELRLKQVLINLVKNALKFTENGFVRILAGFDHTCDRLIIVIADSGKGITEEEMP